MFPINKLVVAKDLIDGMEVGINVDRPCSATVLPDSDIMVSLTRSTYTDDNKGMNERVEST